MPGHASPREGLLRPRAGTRRAPLGQRFSVKTLIILAVVVLLVLFLLGTFRPGRSKGI